MIFAKKTAQNLRGSRFGFRYNIIDLIARSRGSVTSVVRATRQVGVVRGVSLPSPIDSTVNSMGEGKLTPLTTTTPLNRQFLQVGRLYRALILLGLALSLSSERLCVFSLYGAV